jgi:uncharacterized protein YndB with AHSA1/START domain
VNPADNRGVDKGGAMGDDDCRPVSASRRIDAPAGEIFRLLADPSRHPELDGSGMLRPGAGSEVVTGVGDVFVMKMYFTAMGDYEMHNRVVVYEADRCIGWEPALGDADPANAEQTRNGSRWRFDLTPDGPGATVVTETYDCSGSPEQVRRAVDNGNAWIEGMTRTLERLDQLCAKG